ncbi:MAG: non-homologous end-joining DNA ligase [Saprospiraceae bacterium]|nr:non-homologous end-joining DNA ligase [Saprospiraceae bacterium]
MRFGPYSFKVSNQDKILFPEDEISKGDLLEYYMAISDYALPYIENRPIAMHRFPDGIAGKDFFQKDIPAYFPSWIKRIDVAREEGSIKMLLANNKATMAYLANQACIAPHAFLSKVPDLNIPDRIIFDLDPPEGRFDLVVAAAQGLKRIIESKGHTAFIMTTGSSGMHIYVPIRQEYSFEIVRDYAHMICTQLSGHNPELFTTEIRKEKRKGRLFLDYLRNSYGQHSIIPYGIRALPKAPVATPLLWEEIENLPEGSRTFNLANIFSRLDTTGDVWKGMQRHATVITPEVN